MKPRAPRGPLGRSGTEVPVEEGTIFLLLFGSTLLLSLLAGGWLLGPDLGKALRRL